MVPDVGGGSPGSGGYFPAGWNVEAKPCDFCSTTAAALFCRADAAFLCLSCDGKLHSAAGGERHGRVWLCEVCEHAPAAVTCKADAAALCADCDHNIHSANPLAGRHERTQVVPFYGNAAPKSAAGALESENISPADDVFVDSTPERTSDQISDSSWISTDPIITAKFPAENPDPKSVDFFFADSDQFLDFDNYQIRSQPYGDSVVPVQTVVKPLVQPPPENRFEFDVTKSSITSYNNSSSFATPSLSHSFSSSSLEVALVPDGGPALSEISYPFTRAMNPTVELIGNQGSPAVGSDRQARVLRYKEKRKNRKFEKTIRYASRKAYAETRPRIKGRFAKRTDPEPDVNGIFCYGGGSFAGYGAVPSF